MQLQRRLIYYVPMDSILLAIQLWHIEFAKVAGLDNHIIINIFENYLPKGLSKG